MFIKPWPRGKQQEYRNEIQAQSLPYMITTECGMCGSLDLSNLRLISKNLEHWDLHFSLFFLRIPVHLELFPRVLFILKSLDKTVPFLNV